MARSKQLCNTYRRKAAVKKQREEMANKKKDAGTERNDKGKSKSDTGSRVQVDTGEYTGDVLIIVCYANISTCSSPEDAG